ncbi:MAG: hypothetical protein DDG58_05210 [Ardenticatenia bacterium]|nr:MAG: hypothetical protein DDG58_05210 [Ardenticatenia bacterium]
MRSGDTLAPLLGKLRWEHLSVILLLIFACAGLTFVPSVVVSYPAAWALLVLLPGMQLTRWLGLYAGWREGRTLVLSAAAGLVITPSWLHWVGLGLGFNRWTVLGATVVLNLALGVLNVIFPAGVRRRGSLVENRKQRVAFAAMLLVLAVAVIIPYVEWHTEAGVYPVEMGDWFKHYGVAWSIRHTGVPPINVFFNYQGTLVYYYFYHLMVATLNLLTGDISSIHLSFTIWVVLVAITFALLCYLLARRVFGQASVALWSLFCVISVGGLDVIPMLPHNQETLRRTMPEVLNSWLAYFPMQHVDDWSPANYLRLSTLYVNTIWVPQHVSGLVLLLLGLYWLREVPNQRRLLMVAPFLLLSILGHSVWIAMVILACLGIHALLQIGSACRQHKYDVALRIGSAYLIVALVLGVISLPLMREYLSPNAPNSGIAFEIPLTREWAWLSPFKSYFSDTPVTRLLDLLLHYFWELGVLLIGGIAGLWWFKKRVHSEVLLSLFWLLLLISFTAITFFASGRLWKAEGFLMNNDLGLRAIMPAQVVLALFTGYLLAHWHEVSIRRWLRRILSGLLVAFVGLGVLAFIWEVCAMGVSKYLKPPRIDAITYRAFQAMKTYTEPFSIVRHLVYDDNATLYQLTFAQRSPGVSLGEAVVLYSNTDNLLYQLGLRREALKNRLPIWSYQALRELRADYLYIGERTRKAGLYLEKFDNPTYYEKVYEEYPIAIYRVRKLPLERMQARFVPAGIRYMGYIIDEAPVYPLGFRTTSPKALVTAWWLEQPVQQDFTVYIHFLSPEGKVVAQADHQLWSWANQKECPTSQWQTGKLYLDIIPIPSEALQAGTPLRIGIGLWIPQNSEYQRIETTELPVDEYHRLIIGTLEP